MLGASKTAAMDVTLDACAGNAKCGSSIYRCTLDIKNRTGLSHYAWNPLRVCEYDASICCDVPCLDSQRVTPEGNKGKRYKEEGSKTVSHATRDS